MKTFIPYILGACVLAATNSLSFFCGQVFLPDDVWRITDSSSFAHQENDAIGPVLEKCDGLLLFNCSFEYLVNLSDPDKTVIGFYSKETSVTKVSDISNIPIVIQPYPNKFSVLKNISGIEPILNSRSGKPFYTFDDIQNMMGRGAYKVVYFPSQESACKRGFAIGYKMNPRL